MTFNCNFFAKRSNGFSKDTSDSCQFDHNKYINSIKFPFNKLDSLSSDFIADRELSFKPFDNCDYKLIDKFDYYLKNKTDFQGYYLSRQESISNIDLLICELKFPCSNTAYVYTFNKTNKIDSLPLVTYGCTAHPDKDYKLDSLIINYIDTQEIAYFINKNSIKIVSKSYYDLYNLNTKVKIKDIGDYKIKLYQISNNGRFNLIDFDKGIKKPYVDKVWSTL
jgi:hypothetical protein